MPSLLILVLFPFVFTPPAILKCSCSFNEETDGIVHSYVVEIRGLKLRSNLSWLGEASPQKLLFSCSWFARFLASELNCALAVFQEGLVAPIHINSAIVLFVISCDS